MTHIWKVGHPLALIWIERKSLQPKLRAVEVDSKVFATTIGVNATRYHRIIVKHGSNVNPGTIIQ